MERDPLTECSTFVELLRSRAALHPDRLAYRFLAGGEVETASLTYGELDSRARAIAAQLQGFARPDDRALLLFAPGLEFIEAFFGCLYAGIVPVPTTPERAAARRGMTRLPALAADARPALALSTSDLLATITSQIPSIPALAGVSLLAVDEVSGKEPESWVAPDIGSQTLALLQYTSGSTGIPRGVMVTHQNLLANEEMIRHGMDHDAGLVQIGWLPLYHDMGLIGNVLQPLYVGGTCVLMPPVAFLQQPLRWLNTISRYHGTTSGAPNFAFELCARSITAEQKELLDLSSWRVAFNGAEPVRHDTLERFAAAFAPCGFRAEAMYPCYGMAEATLFVSGGIAALPPATCTAGLTALGRGEIAPRPAGDPDGRVLVSSGRAWLEEDIRIVDPSSHVECPPDRIGEVWVSGPHIARGYWNRAEDTAADFHARMAGSGRGPYLRTGDLGFIRDEELYVTGRLKDLIIIRGINHYPHDIERTVETSHALLRAGCGAAFSVDRDQEERLVIVQEIDRRFKPADTVPCMAAVRQSIAEAHGLQTDAIILIATGTIPKTTSGKIQRHLCRSRYLESGLSIAGEWRMSPEQLPGPDEPLAGLPGREELCGWLVGQVARAGGLPPQDVDIDAPFSAYGLDSAHAVALAAELSVWLHRPLSPTLPWQYPTIARLADHLTGRQERDETTHGRLLTRPRTDDPIAVVGMACRFPEAADTAAFWDLLRSGADAISEVPPDRWDANALYDPDLASPDSVNTRWGGFVRDIDQFDPRFFGMSLDEAAGTDPQHRLLLEVAWEALESAGLPPDHIAETETGVFVGVSTGDFYKISVGAPPRGATGVADSLAANRLSYFFDLRGPSMAVDSACSSSLVAAHLACESLRSGSCTMAIAGGVNVMAAPDLTQALSQAGFLSPDGRCKSFSADTDGYVRSEGCGVVILKRLEDARRAGDPILAVIRGSAVNQNGRGNGITAPSVTAQIRVISRALQQAGVSPDSIDYIEAHGSGTSLGDLIEVQALAAVLGPYQSGSNPCLLGSVKTNIGHLEAAAGIAGLIKTILALQHRAIPPHLHLGSLNPRIAEATLAFTIPTSLRRWEVDGRGRRNAGVSSFGFGGTNAHVVVEEAPSPDRPSLAQHAPASYPLLLSARTAPALQAMATRLLAHLEDHPEYSLHAICSTLLHGRARFAHRLAAIISCREELTQVLGAWLNGSSPPMVVTGIEGDGTLPHPAESSGEELRERARQWVAGREVSWPDLGSFEVREIVPLPTYPFQRIRCWPEASRIATPVSAGQE